jgi:thiol-disulfide isomerase/thioredoxin
LEAHKDKLVVMKVFAPWCRACKGLEPKFNAIVRDKKYKDLPIVWADLTIQHNKDYIKSIGVLALPTIQFYAHGQITDTFPCGPSKVPILKRKLVQFINQNVDAETLTLRPPNAVEEEGNTNNVFVVPVDPSTTTTTTSTDPAVAGAVLPTTNNNTVTESGKSASAAAAKTTTQPQEVTVQKMVERTKSKLRAIPYFSAFLESEFEGVLSKASLLTFEGGSIIMKEGNSGRTFYVIVQGEVEICQKTSFEDPLTTPPTYLGTVINRFEQGEYFGERALITGEPRAASIRAAVRTKCLAFDRDDFPATSILSGKVGTGKEEQELDIINEKYGVTLNDIAGIQQSQYMEAVVANQVRGSWNTPEVIDGVDNDRETQTQPPLQNITKEETDVVPATPVGAETIVPLLIRFKLIRLVTRCFDYIVANRPRFGEEGAR